MVNRIARQLSAEFDYGIPILLRSADELQHIVKHNPFLAAGADPATLHVMFMSATPTREKVAALDPQRSPGDRWEVRGQEIYLCLPNGVGRSKLNNAFWEKRLALAATTRNWNSVVHLLELAEG